MTERITNARDLKRGDVVVVAKEMTDKATGKPYWWKRFCVVVEPTGERNILMLTLKMEITDRDFRWEDMRDDRNVITKLPEDKWPQGVSAMYMKHLAKGVFKIED